MVTIIGKYSKFAPAGEKAALRQAGIDADNSDNAEAGEASEAEATDAADAPADTENKQD